MRRRRSCTGGVHPYRLKQASSESLLLCSLQLFHDDIIRTANSGLQSRSAVRLVSKNAAAPAFGYSPSCGAGGPEEAPGGPEEAPGGPEEAPGGLEEAPGGPEEAPGGHLDRRTAAKFPKSVGAALTTGSVITTCAERRMK